MKKNIKYWLLILLATNSFNLLGQKSDTLKLSKEYKSFISLKDFIEEVNKDTNFDGLKLRDTVLSKYKKTKTGDSFKGEKKDSEMHLDFSTTITKGKSIKKISIETVFKILIFVKFF